MEQQFQSQILFYFYGTGDRTKTLDMLGKWSTSELHFVNFPSYFIEIDQNQEPFHLLVNLNFRVEKTLDIQHKMGKCKIGNSSYWQVALQGALSNHIPVTSTTAWHGQWVTSAQEDHQLQKLTF